MTNDVCTANPQAGCGDGVCRWAGRGGTADCRRHDRHRHEPPNGELTVSSSLSAGTDRDRDGNPQTAGPGDQLAAASAVRNNTGAPALVTIRCTLDQPGADHDFTQTEQVNVDPGATPSDAASYPLVGRAPVSQMVGAVP